MHTFEPTKTGAQACLTRWVVCSRSRFIISTSPILLSFLVSVTWTHNCNVLISSSGALACQCSVPEDHHTLNLLPAAFPSGRWVHSSVMNSHRWEKTIRKQASADRQFQRQCLISIILALRAPTPPWVWFASTPHHTTFPSSYYEVWSIKRAKTIGQNFDCWQLYCVVTIQTYFWYRTTNDNSFTLYA